jgi:hypothetical protein
MRQRCNCCTEYVTKVLINPISRTRPRHFRREYHSTRDPILSQEAQTSLRIHVFYWQKLVYQIGARKTTKRAHAELHYHGLTFHILPSISCFIHIYKITKFVTVIVTTWTHYIYSLRSITSSKTLHDTERRTCFNEVCRKEKISDRPM